MARRITLLFLFVAAFFAATAGTNAAQPSSNWCEVVSPTVAVTGQTIEVKVTPREVGKGMQLAVDLHWSRKDGSSGGFLAFAERKEAVSGKPQVFRFTIRAQEGLGRVLPIVFLSPDGSWDKRTKTFNAPAINVTDLDGKASPPAAKAGAVEAERPGSVTFKKSWIRAQPFSGEVTEGESFNLVVDYYLDPSDTWGRGTTLTVVPLGPWIDNPDGKYSTQRTHVSYYGMGVQTQPAKAGQGTLTFTYRAQHLFPYNSLHFLIRFNDSGGKPWPWDIRSGGPKLRPAVKFYSLGTSEPGNLFVYSQRPRVQIRFAESVRKGERKTLRYTVTDTEGHATNGEHAFVSGDPGEMVEFGIDLKRRGVSQIEAEVEGWGRREIVIGWIPEVAQTLDGKRTPFGVSNVGGVAQSRIAQRLGFSWVRHFSSWKQLRPARDVWKLEGMDGTLQTNLKYGLTPWICLIDPPAWVQVHAPRNVGYHPYGFDADALAESVRVMSERWKDQIWGWEWQNEIVPGDAVADPVANYLEFCRVASGAARAVSPALRTQMAGGLWPRNYRTDLLKRGIAEYVDVVPVHYSHADGIRDAQDDLAVAGVKNGRVWDNESATGIAVWKMPLREMVQMRSQSKYVLERWPDVLAAGAEQVTYFGGAADPCGNWSYLLDESTPRPVAATLAVLISKIGHAQPVGKFYHAGSVFHLFEQDGRAVLVAAPIGDKSTVGLSVGAAQVVVTDYQGNESRLATSDGRMSLELSDMPVFVEGADLGILKSYLALSIGTSDRPRSLVQLTAVRGEVFEVPLQVRNLYDTTINAEIVLQPQNGSSSARKVAMTLSPRERKVVQVSVGTSKDAAEQWIARIAFAGRDIPPVEVPFHVSWVNPAMLGNLLQNGDFEKPGTNAATPAGWGLSEGVQRIDSQGSLGTGASVLRYGAQKGWLRASQTVDFPDGLSLLYTAWAQTQNVRQAGSNVTYVMGDGKTRELYIPHVFQAPPTSTGWRLLTFRGAAPQGTRKINFTPLAQVGDGWMLLDNVRVTLWEGSNFAAEAPKAVSAPIIDGNLSDWRGQEPIPLLCDNQLTKFLEKYHWTPENLSGVAYLQWDEQALYLAVEVVDDHAVAQHTGDRTPESDSITLAIQPQRMGRDANSRAFKYYLSAAMPGGGSGKTTLYRPAGYSGGLTSGQLAKDSSVYELVIRRVGNRTVYEAKLPWSELGGVQPRPGSKLGLSLRLDDNDGEGRAAAMTWGDGLEPAWEPSMFGILTLIQ